MVAHHDEPHNADLSEKVIDDSAKSDEGCSSNSGAATTTNWNKTTNNNEEKKPSPQTATNSDGMPSLAPSQTLDKKDDQDSKLSPAVAHVAFQPTSSTTSTGTKSSPLNNEPTNWKKRAAGARATRKDKDSVSEEQVKSIESSSSKVEEMSPDLRINHVLGSVDNGTMDDDHTERNTIEMDDNTLSPPILAAELVESDDEEQERDFVPEENLWENQVQEEFQTRLLTLNQKLVVAEAVTNPSTGSSTKRRWMIWALLLTLVVLAGAIVTGVVTANNRNKAVQAQPSPQQVMQSREQKQVRLRKELTQWMNRTNSDDDLTPFEDPLSPQSLALEWLLNDNITLTENIVTQKVLDRYVLAVLYYSTDGPQWWSNVGSYFLLEKEVCDWNTGIPWSSANTIFASRDPTSAWTYLVETQNETVAGGVYCQGPQDEILLSLNYCGLYGTLPWELSLLSNVVSFQLSYNALVGTIPPELGQLSTLEELGVWSNSLTGTIPTELGYLTALITLIVARSSISGTLPTELGLLTALQDLLVDASRLTGTLPTELGMLTELQYLHAFDNMLTGTLPTELGLLTALQYLFVDANRLTGTLPTELGMLTELQYLRAFDNMLTGTLPTELGMLTELQYLRAFDNMLTGTLPTELGLLTGLLWFWVNDNRLTGTLPTELGLVRALQGLSVYNNKFTGTLPTELGLLTALQYLYVDSNRLTGTLPTELAQLTALLELTLYNNSLTGTLPTSLGYLTNVEYLDVEVNNLTGTLPTELGLLTALHELWVSDNTLTGTLATEMGRLTNLVLLYMENNKLTGPLPTELGQLTALSEFLIFNNALTGILPTEMEQMVSLELLDVSNNLFTGTVPSNLAENLGTNFSFDGNNFTAGTN